MVATAADCAKLTLFFVIAKLTFTAEEVALTFLYLVDATFAYDTACLLALAAVDFAVLAAV